MLPPKPQEERGPVQLFIHYLNELPLREWIEAARRRPYVPHIADAEASLASIVRDYHDRQAVFAAKGAVLEALQRFESAEGRQLTRSLLVTKHLRQTTENALLAVLLRKHLTPDQFASLYVPFESLIPSALLVGLG